jgi:hypothetical protein
MRMRKRKGRRTRCRMIMLRRRKIMMLKKMMMLKDGEKDDNVAEDGAGG